MPVPGSDHTATVSVTGPAPYGEFRLATDVRFGDGIAAELAAALAPYGDRLLVVTDPGVRRTGLVDRILDPVVDAGIVVTVYDAVSPNPRDHECRAAADFALSKSARAIVAIGGGSAIDAAKCAAALATNGGTARDWAVPNRLAHDPLPLIAIPTTAGTGSEVTRGAVITDSEHRTKLTIKDPRLAPRLALVDPSLTQSVPPGVTAATGMDVLTHAIEAYTGRRATPVSDALALHAIRLVARHLADAFEDGDDANARDGMMMASLIAGMAFGNADVAAVHCLAEALGGRYDTPHGVANAVLLPAVMRYNSVAGASTTRRRRRRPRGRYPRPDRRGRRRPLRRCRHRAGPPAGDPPAPGSARRHGDGLPGPGPDGRRQLLHPEQRPPDRRRRLRGAPDRDLGRRAGRRDPTRLTIVGRLERERSGSMLPLRESLSFVKGSSLTATATLQATTGTTATPRLFQPIALRDLEVRNRIWMAPMCQYSAADVGPDTGAPTAWHQVHLGSRAVGGVGMVIAEATAVSPEGRISPNDLGLWNGRQRDAFRPIATFLREQGAAAAIQLAHAGRKASTHAPWRGRGPIAPADGGWQPLGPSAVAFEGLATPRAMTRDDITRTVADFAAAAGRALAAGFQAVEIHGAHGYLIHEFLSPVSNQRTDEYGGPFANRIRFALEVTDAVRAVWPAGLPVLFRVSATDWLAEVGDGRPSWTADDTVRLADELGRHGVDLIDTSSGGNVVGASIPLRPGYQVPFAARIRRETGMPSGAVGLITDPAQAEAILADGEADAILLGRELLRDPYFARRAARELGHEITDGPVQYGRAW